MNRSRRRSDDSGAYSEPDSVRALIVDDESDYRGYIAALARRSGFETEQARDGADALSKLSLGAAYDLIVVDQEMPKLKGLELIPAIRASEAGRGSYALMLTGREDLDTKVSALKAGFDDFLRKTEAEIEIVAKLVAARRVIMRQRTLDLEARKMYGLATRDELTGVFNRRFFVDESERLLSAGTSISLILFDLDDFKRVNDTLGHLAGDRVLRDIGVLFLESTRPDDLIARYGGDEFVMVIADLEIADCLRLSERLSAEVGRLRWSIGPEPFGIGVSTGISTTRLLPEPTLSQLLAAADHDLYKNKWLTRQLREGRRFGPGPTESGQPSTSP